MIKNTQTHLYIALFHQNLFCLITQDPYLYTQVQSEIRVGLLNQKESQHYLNGKAISRKKTNSFL